MCRDRCYLFLIDYDRPNFGKSSAICISKTHFFIHISSFPPVGIVTFNTLYRDNVSFTSEKW